jgi:DNA polymerase (family 10)
MMTFADRCRIDEAEAIAETLVAELSTFPGVERLEVAGSLRRRLETIGDIDLLVSASSESVPGLFDRFNTHPMVLEVLARGDTKSSVRTTSGRQVDLRIVDKSAFPAALMYFTGSKEHNVAMRQRARDKGLTLNEYGLFKLTPEGEADLTQPIRFESEADLYREIGVDFIPPELREDRGEFEWIKTHKPEDLVTEADIRGVLHAHSTWSDGSYSIKDMALACISAGYSYLGLTDHSRAAAYANGLDAKRVYAQWADIDELNESFAKNGIPFHVFKGIESDILTDGSLDYPDEILAGFDFIIASVHSSLDMAPDAMLNRFKRAVDNPHCTIIGHPTGRLLLKRDGNPFDMDALIEHASAAGVAIEINASPWRLDLDWRHGRKAREAGLMSSICPDAHDTEGIADIRFGVGVARKAGFTKSRILNTMSTDDIRTYFSSRG